MSTIFNSEMLQLARNRKSLTQKELSEKTSIPQSLLSKYEIGFTEPTLQQITSLSNALDVTPTFFSFSEQSFPPLTPLIYRRRETVTQKELNRVNAIGNITVKQITKLLKHCDLVNESNLPFFDPQEYNPEDSIDGAKRVANAVRQSLGIPKGPINSMVDLLENNGVLLFYRYDLPRKVDGFTLYPPEQFPYTFANANFQGEKIRMTLAHELGHIIMHRFQTEKCEEEAWAFAREFLAPEEDFLNDIPSRITNIGVLFPLKYKWKISVKSMVMRLQDLEVITERTSRYLYSQLNRYGIAEPYPIEIEKPKVVNMLFDHYKNTLGFSNEDLCKIIGFHNDEYESWYGSKQMWPKNSLNLLLNK